MANNRSLRAITKRLVDLLPVAQGYYYHPAQQGSWSLKAVLPIIVPDLRYDKLDGVQDGGMAMTAYLEAINPQTALPRRHEIRRQLLEYCKLHTYALVRLWQHFAGRTDIQMSSPALHASSQEVNCAAHATSKAQVTTHAD